jgi:hypothetical protein
VTVGDARYPLTHKYVLGPSNPPWQRSLTVFLYGHVTPLLSLVSERAILPSPSTVYQLRREGKDVPEGTSTTLVRALCGPAVETDLFGGALEAPATKSTDPVPASLWEAIQEFAIDCGAPSEVVLHGYPSSGFNRSRLLAIGAIVREVAALQKVDPSAL